MALWMVAVLIATLAVPVGAQTIPEGPDQQSRIVGRVMDAESGEPLAGVTVRLEMMRTLLRLAPRLLAVAETDETGGYEFRGLRTGQYRVSAQRIGYARSAVEVELEAFSVARFSIGLREQALRLDPVVVKAIAPQPFSRTTRDRSPDLSARRAVAKLRQEAFLPSDVRALTQADVVEAITLGETDVFRALQRVPGVTTRDDYTAVLWTRGAAWDQTRVYLDGMPLYNPTHSGWLFSAVNPDGLGAVYFQPGVRSAELGEGAAAVVDLRTREGGTEGRMAGSAEISMVSARLSLDGALLGDRVSWMVAGRRTFLDWVGGVLPFMDSTKVGRVPYDFSDVIARTDVRLPFDWSLQASGIAEQDRVRGDLPGMIVGNRAHWGNRAGSVALEGPVGGGLRARLSAVRTDFATTVRDARPLVSGASDDPEWQQRLPALEAAIRHEGFALRVEPEVVRARSHWRLGVERQSDTVTYNGPLTLLAELLARKDSSMQVVPYLSTGRGTYTALWGETRIQPLVTLDLQAGARLEIGDFVKNGGERRFSPRLSARWKPSPSLHLSAGWGRSYQYTQTISSIGGPLGPQLHVGGIWVLASGTYPAIRSDVATLGVERWIGADWLLAANVYDRSASGITLPDPDSGTVTKIREHVEGSNRAHGVELSARKLRGRVTGSLGYGYGRSSVEAKDQRFAAPSDVRHSFDATAAAQLGRPWMLGAAFTYASGVPYTRLVIAEAKGHLEAPNAERTPAYASLDAQLAYARRIGRAEVVATLQVRNLLDRTNAVTYSGTEGWYECATGEGAECGVRRGADRFDPGLPRLPMLGVRVTF